MSHLLFPINLKELENWIIIDENYILVKRLLHRSA